MSASALLKIKGTTLAEVTPDHREGDSCRLSIMDVLTLASKYGLVDIVGRVSFQP
jgi:hypothetical protein